ncbi:MAG: hypothetical protein K6F91_05680 [Ruminococcus sp.]|nr:hypothetical protein [Ruminococcus sp.]
MLDEKILKTALAAANEEKLIGLANKGLYKRAVKDTEGMDFRYQVTEAGVEFFSGGESCVIKVPFEDSECSCPARGVCRHILSAVMMLKKVMRITEEQPDEQPEPEPQPEPAPKEDPQPQEPPVKDTPLSKNDLKKVHEAADICALQLAGILKRGLVRAEESAADGLEIAAVRCHAARMADAERAVREVGTRLSDCIGRRAAFDERVFVQRLCSCAGLVGRLAADDLTESDLGSFKAAYEDYGGLLDILPIGTRSVTEGDYTGQIYYFLNMDEKSPQRFLSYSDLRPVFYEGAKRIRRGSSEVWGAGVTIKSLMHSRMSLIGAKLSGGKLSSSEQTTIISQQRANLNCAPLRRLVHDDLREIAVELSQKKVKDETDRLFFFHPKKLMGYEFDDMTQQLVAELADSFGNAVRMTAKHTKYTGELIRQLESHLGKMKKHPEGYFVWLVSAYFDEGELILFPIEMYDFIMELEKRDFTLPKEYENTDRRAKYAGSISVLLDDVSDKLCEALRSGIGASLTDTKELVDTAADFGLGSFSRLLKGFFDSAERYRHSFEDNSAEVLEKMSAIYRYIDLAKKKLSLDSALYNMKL